MTVTAMKRQRRVVACKAKPGDEILSQGNWGIVVKVNADAWYIEAKRGTKVYKIEKAPWQLVTIRR
jgi:preprotein translocase subunit YajC